MSDPDSQRRRSRGIAGGIFAFLLGLWGLNCVFHSTGHQSFQYYRMIAKNAESVSGTVVRDPSSQPDCMVLQFQRSNGKWYKSSVCDPSAVQPVGATVALLVSPDGKEVAIDNAATALGNAVVSVILAFFIITVFMGRSRRGASSSRH